MHDERRHSTRFDQSPDDDYAAVWINGDDAQWVEVHDESLGGISLVMDIDRHLRVGQTVQIDYAGSHYSATVRHVNTWTGDKLLIGFRCEVLPFDSPATDGVW